MVRTYFFFALCTMYFSEFRVSEFSTYFAPFFNSALIYYLMEGEKKERKKEGASSKNEK